MRLCLAVTLAIGAALAGCDCGSSHARGPEDAGGIPIDAGTDAGTDSGLPRPDAGICIPGSLTSCGPDAYCAGPDFSRCGGKDIFFGTCELRPDDCTGEPIARVCGCNGSNYDNACLAHAAGVDATDGSCAPGPLCTSTAPCPATGSIQCVAASCSDPWYCLGHMHMCGAPEAHCGCDGVTWFEPGGCPRRPYAHYGECEIQPPAEDCDPRHVLCDVPPPECPEDFAPRVADGCWNGCVPLTTCGCDDSAACPTTGWMCKPLGRCRPR